MPINSSLESKHKLFFLIFLTTIVAVVSALLSGEKTNAIYISVVSIIFIWLTKAIWLPAGYGKTKVRMYSLFVALAAIASGFYGLWYIELATYITNMLPDTWGISSHVNSSKAISFIPIYFFIIIVIWIVNYYMSHSSAMGEQRTVFDKDIPEPDFYDRLEDAIEAFRDHIYSLDKQTNWSRSLFTPLDAEVYVKTKSSRKRKVTDLMKAMKSDSGRAFLILGDPGSGKSVALRKLSLELLNDVKRVKKIPIYVNLKEWVGTNWTEGSPPSVNELLTFVKNNIAKRDIALSIFVDKYFDRLYETRRLFFIFDSFDEIPQVMSVNHNSLLIDQLSDVLYKFLKEKNNKTVGLVASRKFRKPTNYFEASSEIEIRPFNDNRIQSTLIKMGVSKTELINEIFSSRLDLYVVAKNPFMASMIARFIKLHNTLPKNQLEMFSVFIDDSLTYSAAKLDESSINKEEIIHCAKIIAVKMFSQYGLEAPVLDLKRSFPNLKIDSALACLKFSRIVRSNSIDEGRVSFVHRRFCEYFVVLDKLETGGELNFSDIPNDSQWRDALVLYCSVAPKDKASIIADKCWSTIKGNGNKECLESIHCMRFLRDAFKGRTECIEEFQNELSDFISEQIESNNSAYWVKLSVELSTLTTVDKIEESVIKSLCVNDPWISEAAVESCRSLPKISSSLELEIAKYINSISYSQLIYSFPSLYFTFNISDAFYKIKKLLKIRLLDAFLLCIAFIISLSIYPLYTLFIFSMVLLLSGLSYMTSYVMTSKNNKKYLRDKNTLRGKILRRITFYLKKKRKSCVKDSNIKISRYLKKSGFQEGYGQYFQEFTDIIKFIIVGAPVLFIWFIIVMFLTSPDFDPINSYFEKIDNPISIFIIYVICVLSTTRLYFSVGAQKEQEVEKTSRIKFIITLVGLFLVVPYCISLYIRFEEYQVYLQYAFFIIMGCFYGILLIVVTPYVFKHITSFFKSYRKFKSIKLSEIDSRERIHSLIKQFEEFPGIIQKLITYLEVNVTHINGQWPDESILKLSSGHHASRLSKLDVRWRGLD